MNLKTFQEQFPGIKNDKDIGYGHGLVRISESQYRRIQAEVLRAAAIIVQSIPPCSGTKDWNDGRRLALKWASEALLAEANKLTEKGSKTDRV